MFLWAFLPSNSPFPWLWILFMLMFCSCFMPYYFLPIPCFSSVYGWDWCMDQYVSVMLCILYIHLYGQPLLSSGIWCWCIIWLKLAKLRTEQLNSINQINVDMHLYFSYLRDYKILKVSVSSTVSLCCFGLLMCCPIHEQFCQGFLLAFVGLSSLLCWSAGAIGFIQTRPFVH